MTLKYKGFFDGVEDDIHHFAYRIDIALAKMSKRYECPNYDVAKRYLDRLRMTNRSYGMIASYADFLIIPLDHIMKSKKCL
ncbi:MAG: hypothetical protein EB829_06155 [Nitrosopumilus sp. H8]|nr:MAG: hypothetical protein EB829_06155 [Nitrosopumilus sp. H8]